ncbi:uncharacterized protein LOC132048785 [Lycium ferocissimum]|uniref:uncharacterized protein LOC132048785 n=1 Tax=Lycium ferocissimum TaxID=112874 RepID=UPI0028157197|nr:uncharacterized protein LOC132048785 [Lycium ferocissimum]
MGSLSYVQPEKKEIACDIRQLASLGVRLIDSGDGGVTVQDTATSSLVAEIKEHQYEDPILVHYRDTAPQKEKRPFVIIGGGILRYRDRLCVPNIADLPRQGRASEARRLIAGYRDSEMKIGAEDYAKLYLKEIARLHGIPTAIISNRGAQFTANFWRSFQNGLATQLVLALGYPLCASIQAIETGSKYHMRKLVTYWTIFSFISLFEHVFEKLIEWVPLWPYIKLITICWLVISQFNGACYLYQNLICPCFPVKLHDSIRQFSDSCYVYQCLLYVCLSVNLQTVTDWFNKPMEDPSLKNETFLAVAERYLQENGSDALEKLIAKKSKDYISDHHAEGIKPTSDYISDASAEERALTTNQTEREGSGLVWEDITVMEDMAKHEAAEPKQVKSVKENPIQIEKKTTGVLVKEMVIPANTEEIRRD